MSPAGSPAHSQLGSSDNLSVMSPGQTKIDPAKVLSALTDYVNDTDLNQRRIVQLDKRFTNLDEFHSFKTFVETDEERRSAINDLVKQLRQQSARMFDMDARHDELKNEI